MAFQRLNTVPIGVTLLELMIVLSIVSISLSVVAPNVSELLSKHRIIAELNDLSAAIRFSRFEAIDRQDNTLMCPSADYRDCNANDWNLPKIIFVDENHNNRRDNDEALLHVVAKPHKGTWVKGPKRAIRFYGDGVIGSPATLLICPLKPNDKLNRALIVSLQGRVRASKDTNNDEVHELRNGVRVKCQ